MRTFIIEEGSEEYVLRSYTIEAETEEEAIDGHFEGKSEYWDECITHSFCDSIETFDTTREVGKGDQNE